MSHSPFRGSLNKGNKKSDTVNHRKGKGKGNVNHGGRGTKTVQKGGRGSVGYERKKTGRKTLLPRFPEKGP